MRATLIVLAFLCAFAVIDASHFRGGFISYKVVGTNKVTFSFTHVWRWGSSDSIGVYFGDGGFQSFSPSNQVFYGTDAAGEAYGVYTNDYTYQYKSAGVFQVYFTSCCRVYSMINAPSSSYMLIASVDLSTGVSSPVVTIPPLIQLPQSSLAEYQIGVANPSGTYSCRLATQSESYIDYYATAGNGVISVTSGCKIQWNTAAAAAGNKYSVGIIVTQIIDGKPKTSVPIDFVIEITNRQLPTCSVSAASPTAPIGQLWTATITGTSVDPSVTSLTVSALNLASDASLSPAAGSSGAKPFAVTLSVTPTKQGAYSTSIVFKDQYNLQASCTVAYTVPAPVTCAVAFTSCSSKNGVTSYKLTSTSTVDPNPSWESTCGGSFSSATGSSVTLNTGASPKATCNVTAVLTNGQTPVRCPISVSCPFCTTTSGTPCRVDVPAVYKVSDAASIDAYNNGDALAVGLDSDGVITSTTAINLPPGVAVFPNGTFYVSDKTKLDSLSYNVTVTTTDALGGVTTQVITLTFLDVPCGDGLKSCGFACYNPTVHTCFFFQGHRHLCAVNQLICNMEDQCCYDPTQQDCINGTLCPKTYKQCPGIGCYNPSERQCLATPSGTYTYCLTTEQLCGTTCYDSNTWNCHQNTRICLKSEGYCGTGCYDPNAADCVSGQLIPKGYRVCGQANYDPSVYVCFNGHTLCPFGMQLCGASCYPTNQFRCMGDFTTCPYPKDKKCGAACFDDSVYKCCDPSTDRMCELIGGDCQC